MKSTSSISETIMPLDIKVEDEAFPCVMAKTVFGQGNAHRIHCGDMADLSERTIRETLDRIYNEVSEIKRSRGYHSIVLEFAAPVIRCEHQFEALLWDFLQAMHNLDRQTYGWDPKVESDPYSARFSYSLGGEAFYIIGMHPLASRKARRTDIPTLVFNLHSQFEKLRGIGSYATVRDKIRARDIQYSGSMNPMLEDFGLTSEATQYSGRKFDKESWTCPFKATQPPLD